jgi:hypothetical protein
MNKCEHSGLQYRLVCQQPYTPEQEQIHVVWCSVCGAISITNGLDSLVWISPGDPLPVVNNFLMHPYPKKFTEAPE